MKSKWQRIDARRGNINWGCHRMYGVPSLYSNLLLQERGPPFSDVRRLQAPCLRICSEILQLRSLGAISLWPSGTRLGTRPQGQQQMFLFNCRGVAQHLAQVSNRNGGGLSDEISLETDEATIADSFWLSEVSKCYMETKWNINAR